MKDLTHANWIKAKGILFLVTALLAVALLLAECPTWKAVVLQVLAIWCFCRLYYFAFYVIERYVDASYRFSGLGSLLAYLLRRRKSGPPPFSRTS